MEQKEIRRLLRPKGEYSRGDIEHYTELSAGKIRAALMKKSYELMFPLFDLITDKDTTVGDEADKRIASVENKYFTHELDTHYEESIEEIIMAAMHARIFGVSVVELYLDDKGEFAYRFVPREFYYFREGGVWLKKGKKPFKPTAPKFTVIKTKPVLLRTLWIVYAKHYVMSHYMKFTEFLGVPPLIGHASSSETDVIDAMATAFDNLKSGSYAILGKEDIVKILEGRGTQSDFMEFVRYADEQISKTISGSVLSGTATKSGTLALGKIHEKNRKEITAGDVRFAKGIVRSLFKTIELVPNLNIQIEEDVDLYQRAQTLQILKGLGYEITPEQIAKEFDLPLPEAKQINRVIKANAKAANLPMDNIDRFIGGDAFKKELKANEVEIKRELEKILVNAESFDEAFGALAAAYPDTNLDELEDTFTKVMFNADLFGSEEEL